MLSKEDNRLLTQTGLGTPKGELFRRLAGHVPAVRPIPRLWALAPWLDL